MQFLLEEGVIAGTFAILLLLIIILKVADNFFFLMLGEHLNLGYLRLGQLHPRVGQYLLRRQPFQRVRLQDFLQYAQGTFRDVAGGAPAALHVNNLLLQLAHIGGLEGHRAKEHGVEDDAGAPHVRLEPAIALPFEYLGRDVGRCAALFMLYLILTLHKFTDSEIADLDIAFGGEEDVVQFDVAMEDPLAVDVHQALD